MKRKYKYIATNIFLFFYTRWYGRFCSRNCFDAKEDFHKIIIFSSTAMGDFLINTPAIKAVRRRYPAAKITLVASHKNQSLVAHDKCHTMYDNVVYWNNKASSLLTLVKELRAYGEHDLAVILHSRDPYDVIAAIMAGTKYIFRDNPMDLNEMHEFNKWITNYTSSFYGHYIQRKVDLVSLLGSPTDDTTMTLPFHVVAKDKKAGIFYIGFQLGASKENKTWPVEYFAELASLLLKKYSNVEIIIIGSPNERVLVERLLKLISHDDKKRITEYVGKTDMYELANIVASMNLLVTGDTGPLHVAIALKVRTVGLFICTDPLATGAYQDRQLHKVLCPTHHILQIEQGEFGYRGLIQPKEVMEAISSEDIIGMSEDL